MFIFIKLLNVISSPTRQAQRTTEWRNSPNAYLRQEVEETGTPNPKKVTKVNYLTERVMVYRNHCISQLLIYQMAHLPIARLKKYHICIPKMSITAEKLPRWSSIKCFELHRYDCIELKLLILFHTIHSVSECYISQHYNSIQTHVDPLRSKFR